MALTIVLAACGGDSSPTLQPTTAPTPTPGPVRSVVSQGTFTISGPDKDYTYFVRRAFTTNVSGSLEVTIDWTYAESRLWMYLADGVCTGEQFASRDCPGPNCACHFGDMSERQTPKPRILTMADVAPGTRTLIVWNRGPRAESCSYQAVVTSGVATLGLVEGARGTGQMPTEPEEQRRKR